MHIGAGHPKVGAAYQGSSRCSKRSELAWKAFLSNSPLSRTVARLAVTENQSIPRVDTSQKFIVLQATSYVGEYQRFEQAVIRSVAQFVRASLGYEADIAPIVAMDISRMLLMTVFGHLAQFRKKRLGIVTAIIVFRISWPAHPSNQKLAAELKISWLLARLLPFLGLFDAPNVVLNCL